MGGGKRGRGRGGGGGDSAVPGGGSGPLIDAPREIWVFDDIPSDGRARYLICGFESRTELVEKKEEGK